MFFLLCCSAFFSGSETALFSLSSFCRRELNEKCKNGKRINYLLDNGSELLISILLGNLVINVLLFSVSASLSLKVSARYGAWWEAAIGIVVLIALIIFGEVLPKAFGIIHSKKISLIVAAPLKFWYKITSPLALFFLKLINQINNRKKVKRNSITTDELKMLLNYSVSGGSLNNSTGEMIEDVVELSELRVKSIMTPRVDVLFCSIESSLEEVKKMGLENRVYFIPVFEKNEDQVLGLIDVRKVILNKSTKKVIQDFMIKVEYVPENKRCGELLELMNKAKLRTMLVVDEYGGIAGLVTFKDLLAEVLGSVDMEDQENYAMNVIQLDNRCYRVNGTLSVSHWDSFFESPLSETRRFDEIATLGGLVVSLLKRYPKVGDKVTLGKIEFLVDEMNGHRIGWIKVRIK